MLDYKTSDKPIHAGDLLIDLEGEQLPAFVALPNKSAKSYPAIIVMHEVWGLDDHIRSVTTRIAEAGYVAIAPDFFFRDDRPQGDRIEDLRPFMFRIPDARVISDTKAVIAFLRSSSNVMSDQIGAIGFCIGGTWARMTAITKGSLSAVVDFYGRLRYPELSEFKPFQPIDLISDMACPYLGIFGGDDPVIPEADLKELKDRLTDSTVKFDIKVYPGAPHAFFNDSRPLYRNPPAEDAWAAALSFFYDNLNTASKS